MIYTQGMRNFKKKKKKIDCVGCKLIAKFCFKLCVVTHATLLDYVYTCCYCCKYKNTEIAQASTSSSSSSTRFEVFFFSVETITKKKLKKNKTSRYELREFSLLGNNRSL